MTEKETRNEGIEDIVATRTHRRGVRPTILTEEANSAKPWTGDKSKWTDIGDRLSLHQKRRVIGRILKILVETVFGKYIYSFGDSIYI